MNGWFEFNYRFKQLGLSLHETAYAGGGSMKTTVTRKCTECKNNFRTRDPRRKTCCTECSLKRKDGMQGMTVKEWKASNAKKFTVLDN